MKKPKIVSRRKASLADVASAVLNRTITKDQMKDWFEIDPQTSKAFSPVFKINYRNVDVGGLEKTAYAAGHTLAVEAQSAVQKNQHALGAPQFHAYPIIAEGDSWFSHPRNTTVIDVLQQQGYDIVNIAKAGDTIENMVGRPTYLGDLARKTVKTFLFSGGGNDILGNLEEVIELYDIAHPDPSDALWYIRPQFDEDLAVVKSYYQLLLTQIRSASPDTILVVHGYAYAQAQAHGVFIGDKFEQRGFDLLNARQNALAQAIIRIMIDRFNSFLKSFANSSNVEYVDFRPVIGKSNWYDELHPDGATAKRMAKLYAPHLPAKIDAKPARKVA
ncbi:MAG TPA: SGNH/GDSL hydrolase family protein [Rhodoblastus sp.]|nr:SGNH/GDSL hydrolase family protein [Rhodoblastus sp.]